MNSENGRGCVGETARVQVRAYAAVLAVALLARVVWIVAVPVVTVSDSCRYDLFARNLAAGVGYADETGPTAFWPVGPSFLFSLLYRVFGWEHQYQYLPIAVMNLLLGTASVALTMHLARRWSSAKSALFAGLLLALWPSQIEFTTVLSSEIPFIFFMLAALAVWCADRPGMLARAVLAGALLAAASFMRPTALLLPLVFGLSRVVLRSNRLATIGGTVVMATAMVALILPWSMRNKRVFGEFVLMSTNGGVNFWMGNNPSTTGFYQAFPDKHFAGEVDRDRQLRTMGLDYIRRDLWAFLTRSVVKAVRFHERETIGIHWNIEGLRSRCSSQTIAILKWTGQVYWLAVLIVALAGLARLARAKGLVRAAAAPAVSIWCYFTVVHAVTVIQDRYHFAVIPFLAILAATLLATPYEKDERPRLASVHGAVILHGLGICKVLSSFLRMFRGSRIWILFR